MTNKNIIIANWKMNQSFDDVEIWVDAFNKKIDSENQLPDVVVCPPTVLLDYFDEILLGKELDILEAEGEKVEELEESEVEELTAELRSIDLGAQDCGFEEKGAFTGDVSAKMLKDCGCKYVIVGHSERRQHHNESGEMIRGKISSALKNDLMPIFCIGESLEVREGKKYLDFLKKQILGSIPTKTKIEDFVIAYEPIWSIGTGKIPTVDQIDEVVNFVKSEVESNKDFDITNLRVLYGGSTNKGNTAEIMAVENVSGLLVGGASLKPEEFADMVLLAK